MASEGRMMAIQKERLVEIMTTKYDFLYGRHLPTRDRREEWEKITSELNELGPAKTWAQWKEAFTNMKQKVKKKLKTFQQQQSAGDEDNVVQMTEMDEAISKISGWEGLILDGRVHEGLATAGEMEQYWDDSIDALAEDGDMIEEVLEDVLPTPAREDKYALRTIELHKQSILLQHRTLELMERSVRMQQEYFPKILDALKELSSNNNNKNCCKLSCRVRRLNSL